jgi:hypothetical protein
VRPYKKGVQVAEVLEEKYMEERSLEESEVLALPGGTRAFRVDWGRLGRARWLLPLVNVGSVAPDPLVFASVGEGRVLGDITAGKFIGAAPLTVQNVATPDIGKIDVRVFVDFDSPITVQVDYLVVPRF